MKKIITSIVLLLIISLQALPVSAQGGKVYLPLVGSYSQILPCTPTELAALNEPDDQTMPDHPSDSGCILPSETFPGDAHNLIFQNDMPVQSSTVDYWTWPRHVSLYRMDCSLTTLCGSTNSLYIEGALGLFPARGGTLPSGGSWSNYFVGNWVSVGPTGLTVCPGDSTVIRPHVLIGIGQGRFSSAYYSTVPRIFVEKYDGYGCTTTVVTDYDPATTDIHHLQLYQNSYSGGYSYWTARYWRSNQWYYIWTNQAFGHHGEYLMIGGEVGATTLAHASDPTVEMQYISKIRVKLDDYWGWKSYMETNIYYLTGITSKQADSPITMLDWNTGLNFTSMAWEMNPSN